MDPLIAIFTVGVCPASALTYCGPARNAPALLEARQDFVVESAMETQARIRQAFAPRRIRNDWYDYPRNTLATAMQQETWTAHA